MNRLYRAQILLEPDQHRKLAEIAQQEDASISELVRSAVRQWLDERQDESHLHRRLDELKQVAQHRQDILVRRDGNPLVIDVETVIRQMRDERDDQLLDASFGHRR